MTISVNNLEHRIAAIESVLSDASAGNLDARLEIGDMDDPDLLSSIEYGINLMLEDIKEARDQENKTKQALERSLDVTIQQTVELETAIDTIKHQQNSIHELSTPILRLWENVLALPIIGMIDPRRSADMMERLLRDLSREKARFVIVDITGVEIVDTKTADYLIRVIKAAQLLGAVCIVTGIQPAVAQTLIEIGADLSSITTMGTLKEGLKEAMIRQFTNKSLGAPTEERRHG